MCLMSCMAADVRNESLKAALEYCLSAINGDIGKADKIVNTVLYKYTDEGKSREVIAMSLNKFDGMILITFIFNDSEFPIKFDDLANETEVFSYVYNLTYPDMSEFGYTVYENYKRKY